VLRPVIGITAYVTPAKWGYWNLEASLIPHDYVRAVEEAGGRPLLVPPSDDGIEETLDSLDGIVFSGGSDLDPAHYGEEAHPETFGIHEERDRAELELMKAALDRDMPVLGICRGIQVLNVARGGNLVQHLPEIVGHEGHKHDPPGAFVDHDVEIEPDTTLAQILGDRHPVKSHHHQGLDAVGEGLRISAHAADGSIEGVEDPEHRFAVGVLWHPEAGEDRKLFEALVEQAREYKQARST
jgi:putative glutamine amidotransferase